MTLSDSLKQADAGYTAVHLAVGPEGGWTTEEEALFGSEDWQAVSLGPRILRAETAGIAAMAVVAAFIG
jgi:16S rRNA (uracil1498-N3)-methyltransferase